ncbi:MAG TPA: acyltransferase [Acidimicrobiales bacterium]
MSAPFVHPTAIVEDGVEVGEGTAVWSHVHLRSGARIGRQCIVGEKTYVAGGVVVGDRVKINALAYLCAGVTIEDGVMVSAGVVFTNDRYPRAATPDLLELRPSEADESTLPTIVRQGATIGAGAVVGCGIEVGRFAMVGMGSVVTRTVPEFHLVVGNPARPVALVCRCGEPWRRFADGRASEGAAACPACERRYAVVDGGVVEQ